MAPHLIGGAVVDTAHPLPVTIGNPDTSGLATGGLFKIASQTLGANGTPIDFQSIPQTYRHLRAVGQIRSTVAATSDNIVLNINNDLTDANYRFQLAQMTNTTSLGVQATGGAGSRSAIAVAGASAPSVLMGQFVIDFLDYTSAIQKAFSLQNQIWTGHTTGTMIWRTGMGLWLSVSAISRLTFALDGGENMLAGSFVDLYGVNSGFM